MRRFPVAAYGVLVVATVAAFFITQHLKVTTPLINGSPAAVPAAFNPVGGVSGPGEPTSCRRRSQGASQSLPVDYRHTEITFYLQKQPDHVAVYIVNPAGNVVRTLASNYNFARIKQRNPPSAFRWNGRENNGALAPGGTYYFRVVLLGQGRTVQVGQIQVITSPPRPVVRSVSPPLISAPGKTITIHYSGAKGDFDEVVIYRTDLPGGPRPVKSFEVRRNATTATWNGLINGRPAPPGTYLVGLQATDQACNVGRFPPRLPPPPGSTPHAGVSIGYLSADPPLTPVAAGTSATVYVNTTGAYSWALRLSNHGNVVARGVGSGTNLSVRLPGGRPGLYDLALRSATGRIVVPLIAGPPAGAQHRNVLVVLPTLTWQGTNPVDDTGDGVPDTLTGNVPIRLERPFGGLPAGAADEGALLAQLDRAGFHYVLTTDLALLRDPIAVLHQHSGVVLAGSEIWLPSALSTALRSYVQGGGHLLSLGEDSLRRGVTLSAGQALDPTPAASVDAFGARPGAVTSAAHSLMTVLADPLGIFGGTAGAFPGIQRFQVVRPPPGTSASAAGTSGQTTAIIGFRVGRGEVVEIGLPDFGLSVRGSRDLQQLTARVWRMLAT